MSACACTHAIWCPECIASLGDEKPRPRAVILAELRELVVAHVGPSLLPWALEKQDELEAREP